MNRCSPNGDCLYNAVSILRLLTSVELFENSEYYAKNSRMEEVLSSNAEQFLNQNNAFSALLSHESSKCFKGDRVECINNEAALNLKDILVIYGMHDGIVICYQKRYNLNIPKIFRNKNKSTSR